MTVAVTSVPAPRRFAHRPLRRAITTAPMRVSFAGGGTDMPPFNPFVGGRVIGSALDLRVRATVEPFDRGWVRLEVSADDGVVTRRSGDPPRREIAFRLLEAALADAELGDGVRIRVETDVIPGAGLGGSGAAAVAAVAALSAALGDALAPAEEIARAALRIERDGLQLVCGPQDPIFAAFGGLLDLRFDDQGALTPSVAAFDPATLAALDAGLLLVDTGRRRVSGDVLGRAPHTTEIAAELVASADDVARGLARGSLADVLAGMRRSAAAKVRRDPAGNAAAIELTSKLGPLGAEVVRMCGAGEGGHVLVWAPVDRHMAILAELTVTVRKPSLCAEGVRIESLG